MSMTAAILAGGENKRFPYNKAFIEVNGKRLIERTIDTLKSIFDSVVISTNEPESYFYLGLPMIGDVVNERGPMTGIFSVLSYIKEDVFFMACDMPFINKGLLNGIISKGGSVIPVFDGLPQPLVGRYSYKAAGRMLKNIEEGKKGLRDFLKEADVVYMDEAETRAIDPEGLSFVNINTIDDYNKYLKAEKEV